MPNRWRNATQSKEDYKHMINIKFATVTNIAPFNIKFDGENTASTRVYKRLSSYNSITSGDRIAVLVIAGTYLVLGKVV